MIRQGGALVATTWDKALQRLSQELGTARSRGTAANAVFVNQHELGSFPAFLDQWLAGLGMPAHLAYDAEAPLATLAATGNEKYLAGFGPPVQGFRHLPFGNMNAVRDAIDGTTAATTPPRHRP